VPQQIVEVIAMVAKRGPVAGLVNNAGIHTMAAAESLEADAFDDLMRLNLTSMLIASQQVRPLMVEAGGGTIVNMGSLFGDFGVAGNLAYCVSKAGAAALTRCLAVEWAKDCIQVFNVAPGYIETDLNRDFLARETVRKAITKRIPAGRIGTSDDVAGLVGLLFDPRCKFITGETIRIDGGQGIRL
jgi:NAD(P)-dependent dehydrogenase (short-subunit alcohol dehydrogenase family)